MNHRFNRVIIESAKVDNEFVKLTGTNGSRFLPVIGEAVRDQKANRAIWGCWQSAALNSPVNGVF